MVGIEGNPVGKEADVKPTIAAKGAGGCGRDRERGFLLTTKKRVALAVLALLGVSVVVDEISDRAKKASSSLSLGHQGMGMPVVGETGMVGGDDPKLFVPAEGLGDFSRTDIPQKLAELIKNYGKVVYLPKEYDLNKPNLYILGAEHVETATAVGQYYESAYKTQEEILRIFHLLYSLGAERQFLEGIPSGEVLVHNIDNREYDETPVRAMPQYIKHGRVKRAYVAVEGIYGDTVESVGVDMDGNEFMRIVNEYQRFNREEFPKIVRQVIKGVGRDLGIDFDYDSLSGDPGASMRLYSLVRPRIGSMSEEEIKKLAEKHVLSNLLYRERLQIVVEFLYMKIPGRNDAFVHGIREAGRNEKKDAVFILGSNHAPGVLEQLESDGNYNLFFIVTHSSGNDGSDADARTREGYREGVIAADLFGLGLGPKPENPVRF